MPDLVLADYEIGVIVAVEKNWLLIGDAGSTFPIVYFENFKVLVLKKAIKTKT